MADQTDKQTPPDDKVLHHPLNQGGHQGMGGHGGQQSGGMGGMHGGDLHDIGSGGSGMTGRGGMGGNAVGADEGDAGARQGSAQQADQGERQSGDVASDSELGEIQQSTQREGMGNHRHSARGNEQALDADADVDDLGSHVGSAAHSRSKGPS
ncbi:MAG: hypothetical protein ACJ8GW_01615 [Massilia sp.]